MTTPCDTCRRFTHNPEDQEKFCYGAECPAYYKIPELIVKYYLLRTDNNKIDFTNIKIKLEIGKEEYEFTKKN